MEIPSKEMECKHCHQSGRVELVRNLTGSGISQVFWRCMKCGGNANGAGQWIEHRKITNYGIKINQIPVDKDNRTEVCAVCGALGAEYHHWASRHLFGDEADKWPGAWLCNKHHTLWHKLVTPLMALRGNNGHAQIQNSSIPVLPKR